MKKAVFLRLTNNNFIQKKNKSRRLLNYLIAFWVVFCTVPGLFIIHNDFSQAERSFQKENALLVENISNRILIAETAIEGFAAHLETGVYDHGHFSQVAANLLQRYPFLYMFEIAERVEHSARKEKERQLKDVYPGFYIRRFDYAKTRQWVPSEDKPFYYPITFQEPLFQDNRNVLGLDLISSEFLTEAMQASIDKGIAIASRPFLLAENKMGYVIHRPINTGKSIKPEALAGDDYALLALVSENMFGEGGLVNPRLFYSVSHPGFLTGDDNLMLVYEKEGKVDPETINGFFPVLTFKKSLQDKMPSQPFVIKSHRQLGFHDYSVWALVLLLVLMLITPVFAREYIHKFLSVELLKLDDKEALYQLANFDQLTALPNRTRLYDHLEILIGRGLRSGKGFTLFFIDLDDFKPVNDTYGHSVGDYVLYEFSLRLSKSLRENEMLARLGGDEFVLVVDDLITCDHAKKIKQRIRQLFNEPIVHGQNRINLHFSIGESLFPDDGKNIQALLDVADHNMYREKSRKKEGSNVIHVNAAPS